MKRVFLALAILTLSSSLFAQKPELKPYGFVRTYAYVDSRATKGLAEENFFFIPQDEKMVNGSDLNATPSFNLLSITSRLGLDITGYKVGDTRITGKIESDFYCLNGSNNTGVLRMRQAYTKLFWDERGANGGMDYSLLIGQAWHPMAADLANTIALETAAPFTPFSRTAQVNFEATFDKKLTLTGALIQQFQYRSSGPDGATNKYQRHALPELYVGASYKDGGFLGRLGVDVLSIRPHYGYNAEGKKYNEWFTTISPFAYLQYTKGMFQVKTKSILAQAGEHMFLNSGYAVCGIDPADGISNEYTPIRSSVSFVSFQYGKTWQVLGLIGYHKNLGTTEDVTGDVYFSGNGYKNIGQMFRVTPTIAYNLGKMQFACEYNYTGVEYGKNVDARVLPVDTHWVANHRILLMAKLNF